MAYWVNFRNVDNYFLHVIANFTEAFIIIIALLENIKKLGL